jgi:hypothetical protein
MHGFSFENTLYAKATWTNNLVAPLSIMWQYMDTYCNFELEQQT